MLAARFSGRWDDSLEKDRDGNIFINQPADLFAVMIDFLQRMGNSHPVPEATPFPTVQDFGGRIDRFEAFSDMVEYYGMTNLVLPPTIHFDGVADEQGRWKSQNGCDREQGGMYTRICGHYVEARESSLFYLRTQSRDVRRIRSFEVTISNIDIFCIGWGKWDEDALVFQPSSSNLLYKLGKGRGIATGLRVESGSVIRCELEGSQLVWSVNGETYRRPPNSVPEFSFRTGQTNDFYLDMDPMFAGKGTWWVSKIEF
jgi:hypothetical protein